MVYIYRSCDYTIDVDSFGNFIVEPTGEYYRKVEG